MTGSEAILKLGKEMYGDKFRIDETLAKPYNLVYDHFAKQLDPNDTGKGIGLVGAKGRTKTAIMRIMHRLFKDTPRRFRWVTSQDLVLMLDGDDYTVAEVIQMYGRGEFDLYIDDIGLKKNEEVKRWGNSVNLIAELLQVRYQLFVNKGFKTHWSSNMPTLINVEAIKKSDLPQDVKEQLLVTVTLSDIYGERIVDRLNEMDDIVIFKGESLRAA